MHIARPRPAASDLLTPAVRRQVLPTLFALAALWVTLPDAVAGVVFADDFTTSSLNSSTPAAPTSTATAYHLFSSKTRNPQPSISRNDLRFGIAATTSGHIEAQALFSVSPLALTNAGDFIELRVTFTNATGLFTQGGHLGFGLYHSGGVPPIPGGMNGNASTSATTNGGAQGWQGYIAQVAFSGGTHRIATRPAQTIATANNQDLVTDGSGSMSYANDVQLAGTASSFSQAAGSQLTAALRFTHSGTGTLQIDSRLHQGPDTNGTLLVSQSAPATGANFLTDRFDALCIGWRATANATNTLTDIQSITVATSFPIGGAGDSVAGLHYQQPPTDAAVGATLTPPVTVLATNASGRPVSNAPVTLSLANGTGLLSGTLSQLTDGNGTATFANLSFSAVGAKQLQAACGTNTVLSETFNISGAPPAATGLSPANDAVGCCLDTPLRITFDKPVRLQKAGTIRIFNTTAPAVPVDTLDLAANVDNGTVANVQPRLIGGETFTNHPVIVSGNSATIYPHSGVLTPGQTYFVLMDGGVFTDTNDIAFPGLSATNAWRFATKAGAPNNATNLVVAADGSGDFCTVQGAVDFIPSGNTTPRLINLRNGTYTEIVNLNNRHKLTFRGQNRSNSIIAYANNSTLNGSTHYRMVFKVNAHDIALDTLTLTNTTPRGGSQAEALMVETDRKRFVAWNVNLCSYQDTVLLNTSGTQCYFQDSLVQGETDFIWGGGNAFFTNCEIKSLFGGYVTQPRTSATSNGFSFVKCRLTKNGAISTTLGRSFGNPDGNAAFLNCRLDTHITGWTDANMRGWEFGNSNLTGTAAVAYNGTQLSAASLELTNARSAVRWLNGWSPALLPTIATHPASQAALPGQAVEFAVSATGIPSPTYQWRKNGVNINSATNASFSIAGALPVDAASYSVLVATPAGSVLSSNAVLTVSSPQTPAFPGAEGAGAFATGGRGGDVYYVTTLADSGAGSFRNGVSGAPASGRTICFKVSGNIALNSTMTLNRPNLTVAGQTAPGDGICFQNYSLNIAASNIIVRHVRTRLGTNALQEADSMWINRGSRIIVDHVSASWSVDETLSASTEVSDLTVQNCFITESLQNSIHSKGAHGYGGIISATAATTFSYLRNLYAHHDSRSPRVGSDSQAGTLRVDFRNNVIYGWGFRAGYTGDTNESSEINYVGNYLIAGPASTSTSAFLGGGETTGFYQAGNFIDTDKDGRVDGANTGWAMFTGTYAPTNAPFPVPAASTETAGTAYQRVLAQSGALPWRRDAHDQRIARTVRQQFGALVDFVGSGDQPTEYITNSGYIGVRGWPTLNSEPAPADADSDGMPDYWELAVGLNPNLANDRNLTNLTTGYTRLEDFLNWLADPHAAGGRNGPIELDLRALNGGATNLTYTVAAGTNGSVSLLADGFTARFVPLANFSGLAGFTFSALELTNGLGFGPVNVGVLIAATNAPNANHAPVLAAPASHRIVAGTTIQFTNLATDVDLGQTLTFSLLSGPAHATLNSSNGVFLWRPLITESPSTNQISLTVTDNGLPALAATQWFTITVNNPLPPALEISGGASPRLQVNGDAGPDYAVEGSTNLLDWLTLHLAVAPPMPFTWTDTNGLAGPHRFYRVKAGPPLP
jgi:pectin methylesterase-like acyl-CoA thioesterase